MIFDPWSFMVVKHSWFCYSWPKILYVPLTNPNERLGEILKPGYWYLMCSLDYIMSVRLLFITYSPVRDQWNFCPYSSYMQSGQNLLSCMPNFFSMLGSYRSQNSCFLSLCRANKHTQNLRLLLKLAPRLLLVCIILLCSKKVSWCPEILQKSIHILRSCKMEILLLCCIPEFFYSAHKNSVSGCQLTFCAECTSFSNSFPKHLFFIQTNVFTVRLCVAQFHIKRLIILVYLEAKLIYEQHPLLMTRETMWSPVSHVN